MINPSELCLDSLPLIPPKEFTVNYWSEHPCDATYDCEQSATIFATSLDAAIVQFHEDYGNSNILSVYLA